MSGTDVTVTLPAGWVQRLGVLAGDDGRAYGEAAVIRVLLTLADHAQQGVARPGSWERGWVCQVFGDQWLSPAGPDPHHDRKAGE